MGDRDTTPYRPFIHTVARTVALPHGYTLLIWATTMVMVQRHGLPDVASIFLMLTGACIAFLGVGHLGRNVTGGHGGLLRPTVSRPYLVAIGNVATLAIATAACALIRLIPTVYWAWLAVGFTGTAIYLAGFAVQMYVVHRTTAPQ